MPIVGNRFYNDPAIGQAFNNLAGAFAPPSAGDISAYATAAATRAKESRLAEFYQSAQDMGMPHEMIDRKAIALGLIAPNQSYYSVDQGNNVTMRGQDIGAQTSRSNNADDNAGALARQELVNIVTRQNNTDDNAAAMERRKEQDRTALLTNGADNRVVMRGQDIAADTSITNNEADNAGALERRKLQDGTTILTNKADNDRAMAATRYGPLGQNQILPDMPAQVAEQYSLPASTDIVGIVNAGRDETLTLPDNRVIKGAVTPVSADQVKARVLAGLPVNEQRAVALAGVPVEQVVGDDAKVTNVYRPDSVGKTPFVNKGAEAKPQNYRTKDGVLGTAAPGPDGTLIDTQTKQPLPAGTITFGTNVQGNSADTGIAPTQANITEANRRRGEINLGLSRIADYRKLLAENPGVTGVPGAIRGVAQDFRNAIQETVQAYGDQIPAFKSIDEMNSFLDGVAQKNGYDPTIRQAKSLASEMAYLEAKAADPSGEVNVREWERLMDKYDGGIAGNAAVVAALGEFENSLKARLKYQLPELDGSKPDATADAPAAEVWERVDGKLVRTK